MTRKKVKLGWIVSDSARKASLKKRRTGLLKKVSELCILCGVVACVIVYSANEPEPVFFPPSRSEVEEILLRFEQVPEMEKNRKMMNQESYTKERVTKHQEQLAKNLKKNREMEMNHFLHQIHRAAKPYNEFTHTNLHGLRFYIEERWRECRRRMQFFNQAIGEPLPRPPAHMLAGGEEMVRASEHGDVQLDRWIDDVMKNDENVARSSGIDKGKAVVSAHGESSTQVYARGESSSHAGGMVSLYGHWGRSNQGNEAALSQGESSSQVHAHDESSIHAGGMLAPYEHWGSSTHVNEAALFHGNLGEETGVLNFGLPQWPGDTTYGQSVWPPYAGAEGTGGSSVLGPHHSNAEAVGFGYSNVFPHGGAGGGSSQYGIQEHVWNTGGMDTGHDFPLPHPDVEGSNWTSSTNPHAQNIEGGESGHAVMPPHGAIQGRNEGYDWMQQHWNFKAANTGQGTLFLGPYGLAGSGSGFYDMSQYDWNIGGISSNYSTMFPQGDAAVGGIGSNYSTMFPQGDAVVGGISSNYSTMFPQGDAAVGGISSNYSTMFPQGDAAVGGIGSHYSTMFPQGDAAANDDAYGLHLHQGNIEGTGSGLGMELPQGESGGYREDMQGNVGGVITGQQGITLDILGDSGDNNFSTGQLPGIQLPEDPMNIEEPPPDPWARYYPAEGSSRATDVDQKPGEDKDGGNNFSS